MEKAAASGIAGRPDGDPGQPDASPGQPDASPGQPDGRHAARPAAAGRSGRLRGRWVGPVVFVVAGVALFAAYLAQARTVAASSESAGQALQAWDMLHGNPILRGWTLSDVSFYTTELPEYMLVEAIRGLNANTVHVAAALSYTLIVLLGALLAKGRATGREAAVRVLVAAGIMLAPIGGTVLLLSAPDHFGTHVPLLAIWLVLDRPRPRWWVPVAVGVLLAWAQVADTLVLIEGVLPLVAACGLRMIRRRGPLAGQRYDLSLAAAALASVAAARLVLALLRHAGGFIVRPLAVHIASPAEMASELRVSILRVLDVFGADVFRLPPWPGAIVVVAHLAGVALVAWAVIAGVARIYRETDLIAQVLTIAFVVTLGAYFAGTKHDPNEIVGLLPIGAVLAGRLLGRWLAGAQAAGGREAAGQPKTADGRLAGGRIGRAGRVGLISVLAVALAGYGGWLAITAAKPEAHAEIEVTAAWLEAHHLTYGLAGFWKASGITVDSGDRVQVRPARMYDRQLVTTLWESNAAWYAPQHSDATFVIASWSHACEGTCLSHIFLRHQFGRPAVAYHVGHSLVMVWHQNLLNYLPTLFWCGHSWPWGTKGKPQARPCR